MEGDVSRLVYFWATGPRPSLFKEPTLLLTPAICVGHPLKPNSLGIWVQNNKSAGESPRLKLG